METKHDQGTKDRHPRQLGPRRTPTTGEYSPGMNRQLVHRKHRRHKTTDAIPGDSNVISIRSPPSLSQFRGQSESEIRLSICLTNPNCPNYSFFRQWQKYFEFTEEFGKFCKFPQAEQRAEGAGLLPVLSVCLSAFALAWWLVCGWLAILAASGLRSANH